MKWLILATIVGSIIFILVWHAVWTARSLPKVRLIFRPGLFLQMARETQIFYSLEDVWKKATHHTNYLHLPQLNNEWVRSSAGILRAIYQTFHPAQIIAQMQKIGHEFLAPLTHHNKRRFLRRLLAEIALDIPEAAPALRRAYYKRGWFKSWNRTIQDVFYHIHKEIEKEPELLPHLNKFWYRCSQLIASKETPALFFPSDYEPTRFSRVEKISNNSEEIAIIQQNVNRLRTGLLAGTWYVRRKRKGVRDILFPKKGEISGEEIPDYLNKAEKNYFDHDVDSTSILTGEHYTGYSSFPIIYMGGSIYKQYLLLKQDKTDIQTSLVFVAIDAGTQGVGYMLIAGIVSGVKIVKTFGAILILESIRWFRNQLKEKLFERAKRKYQRFLDEQEKALCKAALTMIDHIGTARDIEQEKLNNQPYNQPPRKPDEQLGKKLIKEFRENILIEMERLRDIGEDLQKRSTITGNPIITLIIRYRLWLIRYYQQKNASFLRRFLNYEENDIARLFRASCFLPVTPISNRRQQQIIQALRHYNNCYTIGMVNRVFSLYGLLQKAFASLVIPIEKATERFDETAKIWNLKNQKAYKKLSNVASQSGRTPRKVPTKNRAFLWEYRRLLHRKNGKWTYGRAI